MNILASVEEQERQTEGYEKNCHQTRILLTILIFCGCLQQGGAGQRFGLLQRACKLTFAVRWQLGKVFII